MVGLLLIHEAGHALTMRALGIPFGPMVFLPFMGAVVEMKGQPRNAYIEALVALGGPVLGSAGAAGVAAAGFATNSQLLIALGDFGFMINLFNLMPLGSMDGGRISGAVRLILTS
jgi:Zn-dependent protease